LVVDTSGSTQGLKLDIMKRDLEQLLLPAGATARRGKLTVISSSTRAEIVADNLSSYPDIKKAFASLRSSGGSCVREALARALDKFNESATMVNRRAIVVFVDGPDLLSRISKTDIETRLRQVLSRRKIAFYVVGLSAARQDVSEMAALAERVGGTFILAPVERFTVQMQLLFKEVG